LVIATHFGKPPIFTLLPKAAKAAKEAKAAKAAKAAKGTKKSKASTETVATSGFFLKENISQI
jgi:hypothetical protein